MFRNTCLTGRLAAACIALLCLSPCAFLRGKNIPLYIKAARTLPLARDGFWDYRDAGFSADLGIGRPFKTRFLSYANMNLTYSPFDKAFFENKRGKIDTVADRFIKPTDISTNPLNSVSLTLGLRVCLQPEHDYGIYLCGEAGAYRSHVPAIKYVEGADTLAVGNADTLAVEGFTRFGLTGSAAAGYRFRLAYNKEAFCECAFRSLFNVKSGETKTSPHQTDLLIKLGFAYTF
jgi:hypothetical protein